MARVHRKKRNKSGKLKAPKQKQTISKMKGVNKGFGRRPFQYKY